MLSHMTAHVTPILTRQGLANHARSNRRQTVDIALRLLATPSENPPGDTRGIDAEMLALLNEMPGVKAELHASSDSIHNVVARLKGGRSGPRLIFNGHLDTFPLSGKDEWGASPAGALVGSRVYGLGISDMKGGLAASLFALQNLAIARSSWAGEVVATFGGDEETMGGWERSSCSIPSPRRGVMR
jgi:succinyl-diaminopimelate desuccinylase